MQAILAYTLVFLAGAAAGAWILAALRFMKRGAGLDAARATARGILDAAETEARARTEAAALEVRLRIETAEAKAEEVAQKHQREIEEQRQDIERRDKDLKRRVAFADEKMRQVQERETGLVQKESEIAKAREEAAELTTRQRARLEQIAGYSSREAREELRREMELEARREAAATIVRIQEETRERADDEAHWITAQAMQRLPISQYAESTVTVVNLKSDDMKGRIIGREGRNIRAIEMGCGIDLIIDDTPGVITLSSFDPTRRLVAKMSIERLIEDGRIHPARIEEVIAKVREEFDKLTFDQGEAAAFELGVHDLNPRLIKMAGRLQFVTFHGQTLLTHSKEVALLAAHMASLLAAQIDLVRRAGFLHEVGFGDETLADRSPRLATADIVQRLGEAEPIVHCIQAVHGIVAPRTVEAVLLQVAEAASTGRPGARKEMLQEHIEHLTALEDIARSFKGVRQAHAVRAGKEVRVIVAAENLADREVVWLSRDIAGRIEKEARYPGQLRVSVIRETRSVDFAM